MHNMQCSVASTYGAIIATLADNQFWRPLFCKAAARSGDNAESALVWQVSEFEHKLCLSYGCMLRDCKVESLYSL